MMAVLMGSAVMFAADIERLVLGEVDKLWDKLTIAMSPSRDVMRDMRCSPKMLQIGNHCAAGLTGQLNIETAWRKRGMAG
jgi:hypothetical protein